MLGPIGLSSLELEPTGGLVRIPPRPSDQRNPDYETQFDYHTVLYDAFRSLDGEWIVLVGPPFAKLAPVIVPALMRAFALEPSRIRQLLARALRMERGVRMRLRALDRHAQLWLRSGRSRGELPPGLFKQTGLEVQPNEHSRFRGKNVVVTQSRDNDLLWIRDWVRFHAKAHGCNAVLFYDNASTRYEAADLEEAIASIDGIDTALVIRWPFKIGPGGEGRAAWDSDYGQYGLLEHARRRFLSTAGAVMSIDIDELVLTDNGSSIFDTVRRSDTGYVRFAGRWIENATSAVPDPTRRRHQHYVYYREGPPAASKWAVVPGRCPHGVQWRVHDIHGMEPDSRASAAVTYRHFRAISTNWKYERWKPEVVNPAIHRMDEELAQWLKRFAVGDAICR